MTEWDIALTREHDSDEWTLRIGLPNGDRRGIVVKGDSAAQVQQWASSELIRGVFPPEERGVNVTGWTLIEGTPGDPVEEYRPTLSP